MEFSLEKYKIFPFIAWTVFIGFAIFVGGLALELYDVTSTLAEDSHRLEQVAQDNSARLDALEAEINSRTDGR